MQAVILAAGMGTRIRDHFQLPKGFIPLNDKPIIFSSIEKIKAAGINQICIIAGHLSEHYIELARKDSDLTVIVNPYYNQYSSLYSLYCAKDWVSENCLILESDIYYESRALKTLINYPAEDAILVSGTTHSGDEVYVTGDQFNITGMSKDRDSLKNKHVYGEFVGINKLSYKTFSQFMTLLEHNSDLLQTGFYEEDGFVALSQEMPLACAKVPDLLWCEIDNIAQLNHAKVVHQKVMNKRMQPHDVK